MGGGWWGELVEFSKFSQKGERGREVQGGLSFQNFLKKGGGVQIFSIEREGLVK